ncbi:MAG: M56 family metallopeptidase [Planctomycetota bacterium]
MITSYLTDELIRIAPELQSLALRVAMLSVAIWAASTLWRRRPARQRARLWSLFFFGVAGLPLLALLPSWTVPGLHSPTELQGLSIQDQGAPTDAVTVLDGAQVTNGSAAELAEDESSSAAFPWSALWIALWASGALFQIGAVLLGLARAAALARRGRSLVAAEWRDLARQVATKIELSKVPRLIETDEVDSPMTGGLLHPFILLPAESASWTDEQRRIVLLHEMTHVRRRDWLALIAARLLCAAHWFNPLVWAALRRARLEREKACDECVIASGVQASSYARQLLDVALHSNRSRGLATLAMARRTELEERIMSLVQQQSRPSRGGSAALWPLIGLTTLIVSIGTAGWSTQATAIEEAILSESSSRLQGDEPIHFDVQGQLVIRDGKLFLSRGTVVVLSSEATGRWLQLERRADGRVLARYTEGGQPTSFDPGGRAWLSAVIESTSANAGLTLTSHGPGARATSTSSGGGPRLGNSIGGGASGVVTPGPRAGGVVTPGPSAGGTVGRRTASGLPGIGTGRAGGGVSAGPSGPRGVITPGPSAPRGVITPGPTGGDSLPTESEASGRARASQPSRRGGAGAGASRRSGDGGGGIGGRVRAAELPSLDSGDNSRDGSGSNNVLGIGGGSGGSVRRSRSSDGSGGRSNRVTGVIVDNGGDGAPETRSLSTLPKTDGRLSGVVVDSDGRRIGGITGVAVESPAGGSATSDGSTVGFGSGGSRRANPVAGSHAGRASTVVSGSNPAESPSGAISRRATGGVVQSGNGAGGASRGSRANTVTRLPEEGAQSAGRRRRMATGETAGSLTSRPTTGSEQIEIVIEGLAVLSTGSDWQVDPTPGSTVTVRADGADSAESLELHRSESGKLTVQYSRNGRPAELSDAARKRFHGRLGSLQVTGTLTGTIRYSR